MRYSEGVAAAIEGARRSRRVISQAEIRQQALDIGMLVEWSDHITLHNGFIPMSLPGKCSRELIESNRGRPLDLQNASRLSFGHSGMRVSWRAEIRQWGTVAYLVQVDDGFNLRLRGGYEVPDSLLLAWMEISGYEKQVFDHPVVEIRVPTEQLPKPPKNAGDDADQVIYEVDLICFSSEIPVGTSEKLIRLVSN